MRSLILLAALLAFPSDAESAGENNDNDNASVSTGINNQKLGPDSALVLLKTALVRLGDGKNKVKWHFDNVTLERYNFNKMGVKDQANAILSAYKAMGVAASNSEALTHAVGELRKTRDSVLSEFVDTLGYLKLGDYYRSEWRKQGGSLAGLAEQLGNMLQAMGYIAILQGGGKMNPGYEAMYHEAWQYLKPLFENSAVSGDDLLQIAAAYDSKQSIFAVLEQLHIRGAFEHDGNMKRANYYDIHIKELKGLDELKRIDDIKNLRSGHAILALLNSMNEGVALQLSGDTIRALCGANTDLRHVAKLLEQLLNDAYTGRSRASVGGDTAVEKLLASVTEEIKSNMLRSFAGMSFGEVFDNAKLWENAKAESEHIVKLMLNEAEGRVKYGDFFTANEHVLNLIASGDQKYSKQLIEDVLKHGDNASVLHVLSLLDPEKHRELFEEFERAAHASPLKGDKVGRFIEEVRQNMSAYFPENEDVVFKFNGSVQDEIDYAKQNFSNHEDIAMARRLLAARNNAIKSTPGFSGTTVSDKKE